MPWGRQFRLKPTLICPLQTCEKWDLCYGRVLEDIAKRPPTLPDGTQSDEEVYEQLTGDAGKAGRPFKYPGGTQCQEAEPGEAPSNPEEDLYSAVSESTSKLCIHYMALIKKILPLGDVNSLLRVFSGLSLVRNKLWQYNETLIVNGHSKAFKAAVSEFSR